MPTPVQHDRTGFGSSIKYLLFEFDSLRLIAPSNDPHYAAWLRERSRHLASYSQLSQLLLPTLCLFALLCLLRVAFFRLLVTGRLRVWRGSRCSGSRLTGPAGKAARGKSAGGTHLVLLMRRRHGGPDGTAAVAAAEAAAEEAAEAAGGEGAATQEEEEEDEELRLGEGCWTLAGGSGLLLWGWLCVSFWNGGCPAWPSLATSRCLAGWPMLPLPPPVRHYYVCEAAWYLHLLAKSRLGVGLQDGPMMVAHHVASLTLIVLSYAFSLHRPGVLLAALLNASTPLLHLSKAAHHAGWRKVAAPAFAVFAAVFFVSRVLLFPAIFLPLGVMQPLHDIPGVLQHFPAIYFLFNGLLWLLAAMQWVWFAAVLRVLSKTVGGDEAKLDEEARRWEQQGVSARHPEAATPRGGASRRRGHCGDGGDGRCVWTGDGGEAYKQSSPAPRPWLSPMAVPPPQCWLMPGVAPPVEVTSAAVALGCGVRVGVHGACLELSCDVTG